MTEHDNCSEYCHMLSDFIDGELAPEFCEKLEEHLKGCTHCRVVLDTLRKTVEIYKETEKPAQIPGGVKERLFASLSLDQYRKQ